MKKVYQKEVKWKDKKKSDKENQEGQWLKILTPNQILLRLRITLTQLKAGNNSEKFKNKITQLLYYLNRSKLTKKSINIWLVLFKKRNLL